MRSLSFHSFRLESDDQRLWHGSTPVGLRPKTFAVLKYLVERPGKLVKNDELLDAVWEDAAVTPGTLNTSIRELRKALGDDARQPIYIETVHRRGFRFVAPVRSAEAEDEDDASTADETVAVQVSPASPASPIVATGQGSVHGRDDALDELEACLTRAKDGKRQVVFVTGEVGIGKTSVLRTFADRHREAVDQARLSLARGQCLQSHGEGEAYHPVLDALERLTRTEAGKRLPDLMKRFAPTWALRLPWLAEPDELVELRESVGTVTTARMLREFSVLADAFAREQPLVLVLEDMHWSDPATVDLVGALARRSDDARLLLLATYRPVDAAMNEHPITLLCRKLQRERAASQLALPPLSASDVASYLRERFEWREIPSNLAAVVHEQSDGNPLLMVTLTNHLVSRELLTQVDGMWSLSASPESIVAGAPEGLRELVDEDLENLGREEREALELASVAGDSFVARELTAEPEHLEPTYQRLAQLGHFIEESGEARWPDGSVGARFQFVHAAFRRILYGRLAPARRRQVHLEIAERIETAFASDVDARALQLAVHYERGGDIARSVEHLARATAAARRRLASREAASYARRAIELLVATPHHRISDARERELSLELGRSLAALSFSSASSSTSASLDRSVELSRKLGLTRLESPRDEEEGTLNDNIERLPPEQKEAVKLHYFSGLSYSEIARFTGTTPETVASRVLAGLNRFGVNLKEARGL